MHERHIYFTSFLSKKKKKKRKVTQGNTDLVSFTKKEKEYLFLVSPFSHCFLVNIKYFSDIFRRGTYALILYVLFFILFFWKTVRACFIFFAQKIHSKKKKRDYGLGMG